MCHFVENVSREKPLLLVGHSGGVPVSKSISMYSVPSWFCILRAVTGLRSASALTNLGYKVEAVVALMGAPDRSQVPDKRFQLAVVYATDDK